MKRAAHKVSLEGGENSGARKKRPKRVERETGTQSFVRQGHICGSAVNRALQEGGGEEKISMEA